MKTTGVDADNKEQINPIAKQPELVCLKSKLEEKYDIYTLHPEAGDLSEWEGDAKSQIQYSNFLYMRDMIKEDL